MDEGLLDGICGEIVFIPRTIAISLVALAAGASHAQGTDPNLSRDVAAGCANCHGTNGASHGGMPSLAGQSRDDLVRKMQDYKAGRAAGTIMPQLAKGYTDAQIGLAADWFAAQKPGKAP